MWANDFRFSSHWSNFCIFRPRLKLKFSTFRLCHATPTGSGTSPNILRDIRLTIAPYKPVSSALGILGLLDMMSPPMNCSRHRDTGHASNVTPEPDMAASRGESQFPGPLLLSASYDTPHFLIATGGDRSRGDCVAVTSGGALTPASRVELPTPPQHGEEARRAVVAAMVADRRQSSARSRLYAALINARWVRACGKFPCCSPVWPI